MPRVTIAKKLVGVWMFPHPTERTQWVVDFEHENLHVHTVVIDNSRKNQLERRLSRLQWVRFLGNDRHGRYFHWTPEVLR